MSWLAWGLSAGIGMWLGLGTSGFYVGKVVFCFSPLALGLALVMRGRGRGRAVVALAALTLQVALGAYGGYLAWEPGTDGQVGIAIGLVILAQLAAGIVGLIVVGFLPKSAGTSAAVTQSRRTDQPQRDVPV